MQVIPFEAGAHAGLLAHFAIAEVDGRRDTVYLETATVGQVIEMPAVIAQASVVFEPSAPWPCRAAPPST